MAEATSPDLFNREQGEAIRKLEAHHDELLALLEESADRDPATAIRLAVALWRYWFLRGHLALVAPAIERAVTRAPETRGLVTLGVICFFLGRHDDAARQVAKLTGLEGEDLAFARTVEGWVAQGRGDWETASQAFDESLHAFRALHHRWGEALSLLNLGEVARSRGNLTAARRHYDADLAIYRELGEQSAIAATLCNLGFVDLAEGRDPSAALSEALELSRSVGNRQFIPGILIGFASWHLASGDAERARRLVAEADAEIEQLGSAYEPADQLERDRVVARLR